MKKLLILASTISFFAISTVTAMGSKQSTLPIYQIEINEKPVESEDMQKLDEQVGNTYDYTGYIILDKKTDDYVLVYSKDLAKKAASDKKLFKQIYKHSDSRGIDHGTGFFSNKKLILSDPNGDYSSLFEGRLGSIYSAKSDINYQLTSKVTKFHD